MIGLFLLATLFFTCVAFFSIEVLSDPVSPFTRFYSFETSVIVHNVIIFLIIFLVITIIFIVTYPQHKKHSLHRKTTISIFNIFLIGIGGLFSAFILLWVIAFFQLNIYAVLINSNPQLAGIITDKNKIETYLKTTTDVPRVMTGQSDQHTELLSVAGVGTGTTNFYGKYILPLVPSFLIIPVHTPKSNILLIDNTLLFTTITSKDIETVSPYIGYLFLNSYFRERIIKRYPIVALYSRQEYVKKRQGDVEQTVITMTNQLSQLETAMSSVSAQIELESSTVASLSAARTRISREKVIDVQRCKAEKESSCEGVIADWNKQIDRQTRIVDAAQATLEKNRKKLKEYTTYHDFFVARIPIVAASKEALPFEVGVFTPKNVIRLALDKTDPHGIADYLETLTHEYLHYASYISEDKEFNDLFFEEGLTEYFARRTIEKNLQVSTNVAYPVVVKIIEGMTQMLTESELSDLYFSKDQAALEAALNRVYGDGFYEKNRVRFATIQYAVDPKETLKVANEIMQQIGGKKLTEKDLRSTSTNF